MLLPCRLVYLSFTAGGNEDKTLQVMRSVAQPGSAPGLGPGGRRFKSFRSDQIFQRVAMRVVAPFFYVRRTWRVVQIQAKRLAYASIELDRQGSRHL